MQTVNTWMQPVFVLISDLNYDSQPDRVQIIERQEWYRKKRFKGRYLIQRISEEKYFEKCEELEREKFKAEYKKRIQEKYNVGPNFEQNTWFMEQVRPTLY